MPTEGVPDPIPTSDEAPRPADDEPLPPEPARSDEQPLPDDPRVDADYVRTIPGTDGAADVSLVGVVHDHPAAVHRVQSVIRAFEPATVALELPAVAVPLYEAYADDGRSRPAFGGEMSAAVAAARAVDARVVGVDAPSRRFLGALAGRLRRERPSPAVVRRLLGGLLAVTRHALTCRLAAAVAATTGLRVEVDDPVEHAVGPADPPAVQADDERRQLSAGRSLRRLADAPTVELRDDVREASMAAHLASLRGVTADGTAGDVVAVVGHDHLDGLDSELRRRTG